MTKPVILDSRYKAFLFKTYTNEYSLFWKKNNYSPIIFNLKNY